MELRSILLRNNSINQNRAVLGGLPITAVHATDLKIGLTPPAIILQGDSVNTTMLERDIQSLIDIMAAQNREHIARADEGLRSLLKIICSDTHMLHALSRLRLTEMGLTLRLNMRSGELREQELEQGSQQRFPSSSHVVNKLKEAQIQG